MDYATLLQLRESCAGGTNAAKRLANSALKTLRWRETGGAPGDWDTMVDLTDNAVAAMRFELLEARSLLDAAIIRFGQLDDKTAVLGAQSVAGRRRHRRRGERPGLQHSFGVSHPS